MPITIWAVPSASSAVPCAWRGTHGGGQQAHTHTAVLPLPPREFPGRTAASSAPPPQDVQHRTQMLLGKHLGRGEIADWLPASATCSMARRATTVLPEPTSPCSRRFSGRPARQIGGNPAPTFCCPSVSLQGRTSSSDRRGHPPTAGAAGSGARHAPNAGGRAPAARTPHGNASEPARHARCPSESGCRARYVHSSEGTFAGATNRRHRIFKFFERHLFEQPRHVAANAVGGQLHGAR